MKICGMHPKQWKEHTPTVWSLLVFCRSIAHCNFVAVVRVMYLLYLSLHILQSLALESKFNVGLNRKDFTCLVWIDESFPYPRPSVSFCWTEINCDWPCFMWCFFFCKTCHLVEFNSRHWLSNTNELLSDNYHYGIVRTCIDRDWSSASYTCDLIRWRLQIALQSLLQELFQLGTSKHLNNFNSWKIERKRQGTNSSIPYS